MILDYIGLDTCIDILFALLLMLIFQFNRYAKKQTEYSDKLNNRIYELEKNLVLEATAMTKVGS